ncbi:MAG: ATP-binding protein [Massilia sp.]
MSDFDHWLDENNRYLGEAIAWLRRRLERMAPAPVAPVPPHAAAAPGIWQRFHGGGEHPASPAAAIALPAPSEAPEPVEGDPPPALAVLAARLGLSGFERNVLLLCAAMEFDTRIADLCARAQGNQGRNYPTFGLALALFEAPAWEALSPHRPLRYWRLIEIRQPQGVPLIAATLNADERIVNYLKGLNYLDERLAVRLMAEGAAGAPLAPSQQAVAQQLVQALSGDGGPRGLPVIQLLGQDGASKRAIARAAAEGLGCELYLLDGESLPGGAAEVEDFARLWQRESLLLPLALYLDADELDAGPGGETRRVAFSRLLRRTGGPAFLASAEPWGRLGREVRNVEAAKPAAPEQRDAWQAALDGASADPGQAGRDAARLASHFNLNLDDIRQIASGARGHDLAALWDSTLMHARPALDRLAQRIDALAGWDDLKLPEAETALLRQVAEQVSWRAAVYDEWGFRNRMNRGLGISALFAGDSGTGKTMAAEVIARELKLLMYRIDLSAVVSKFIGETEKNLRRLFDAADDSGAILFFDEADALFGKRSEVKDSHDRYANIEVNYLLQRMESYRGLAILATNRKSALDSAFLRRLRFVINFPFPGPGQRKEIWRGIFPPQAPLAELDWDRLARFNLSGGSIQNIALGAAFLAARAGQPVGMPLVLEAIRTELRKLDKPFNEAELRPLAPAAGAWP